MNKIVLIISSLVVLLFMAFFYQKAALDTSFGDEQNNFILGKYVASGEKVYGDLFANHQPLAYIASAAVQKISNPKSINSLLLRHRQAMEIWSIIWFLLLIWRFGKISVPISISIEAIKVFFLGNLFLSESLAAFPLVCLALFCLRETDMSITDWLLIGVCLGIVTFLLLPLWPLLAFLGIILLVKLRTHLSKIGALLCGFIFILLIVLNFISLPLYFRDSLFFNLHYYIPAETGQSPKFHLLLSFISPILSFFSTPISTSLKIIQLWSAIFLIGIGSLIYFKKIKQALLSIIILGLSNLRFIPLGSELYAGFHLFPWISILISISCLNFVPLIRKFRISSVALVIATCLTIYLSGPLIFQKNDPELSFFINYSKSYSLGQAVRIMSRPGDKLLSVPSEWLIYFQSDLPHASRMLEDYDWMENVPELRSDFDVLFPKNRPAFFFCECGSSYLKKYLTDYVPLQKDNKKTDLYVTKQKLTSLTSQQKSELKYLNFTTEQ